jgi:cytochrome c-type biogenesis protein CcmE
MTPRKRRRLILGLAGLACVAAAAALVLSSLGDQLVFFLSPTEIVAKAPPPTQRIRIGGLVEQGSVSRSEDGGTVTFRVTDLTTSVPVTYRGMLPALFREGQGVVAEGTRQPDGSVKADQVLAKHDETYMPKEVVEALKASGRWKEGDPMPDTAHPGTAGAGKP